MSSLQEPDDTDANVLPHFIQIQEGDEEHLPYAVVYHQVKK